MVKAGLEMAVWDWCGRAAGVSLGRTGAHPAGGACGGGGDPHIDRQLGDTVRARVAAGYQRGKITIQPGWGRKSLEALRSTSPAVVPWADANWSYTLADAPHLT